MNAQDRDKSHRVIHREYKDPQGNVHTEYEDIKGDLHTEYKDPQGNIHSYKSGYINSHLAEEQAQDMRESRADKNRSKGIVTGVIVTCVAGLMVWTIYLFNQMNNPQPVSIINLPTLESSPTPEPLPEPVKVVEQPIVEVVPVRRTQMPESTQKTTAQPSASNPSPKQGSINAAKPSKNAGAITPKPIAVSPSNGSVTSSKPSQDAGAIAPKPIAVPPSNGNVTSSNVTKTDSDLQKEILTKFNNNLFNNQLIVDVKNGEVTVSGTAATPEELQQIQPLLNSIKGIGKVDVTATVASQK